MEILFIVITFAWIIVVYVCRVVSQWRTYVDVLRPAVSPAPVVPAVPPPTYGVPPATSMVLGSAAHLSDGNQ